LYIWQVKNIDKKKTLKKEGLFCCRKKMNKFFIIGYYQNEGYMERKSVSATILVLYLAGLFAVIGSCFYAFIFKENQIKVEAVFIETKGVAVYQDNEKNNPATELNLSDMEIGIRPATGKLDKETQIPSTICSDGTSEGYYASVFVDFGVNYKIVLKDINIESEKHELDLKEQRKNIFIAIEDIKNTTKSLEEDEITLVTFQDTNSMQELTFLIWIGAFADDGLKGSKISFTLDFVAI
jgi:dimeric dUTPase (all-alpha-NTP-PPase superfamily)